MECSDKFLEITGYLSFLSILITLYGVYAQGKSIMNKNKKLLAIFPITLMITLLMRLPTQVCIALEHAYGWYSVFGILIKLISLAFLSYLSTIY